uniref:Glycosyltransferase-like protein n=1 Tax=Bordetella petrii TaxID=94624 RepID=I1SZ90_9BORD|nr:glycosyltransferase-like protein [Bordetella petrii]
MKKLKGFAVSWFFAPYIGSADLDFFKRIKDTNISYTVVQAARDRRDDQVLKYASTDIERIEVKVDHANPRTESARAAFVRAVLDAYARSGEQFDFIISHSNELVSHAAAAEIKKLHPELPWIAYFGDLFVRNPYVTRGFPLAAEDRAIERDTLRQADRVILNNSYQRDLMFTGDLAPLADKAVVIPHCFDPRMYPQTATQSNDKFVFPTWACCTTSSVRLRRFSARWIACLKSIPSITAASRYDSMAPLPARRTCSSMLQCAIPATCGSKNRCPMRRACA